MSPAKEPPPPAPRPGPSLAGTPAAPLPPCPLEVRDLCPDDVLIDLRSPREFAGGHIPGARPLPLLDDEQRARVGTTYRNHGSYPATLLGLDLIGPRLSSLVDGIARLCPTGRVVLYCWRGGLRSRVLTDLVRSLGIPATRLEGGYRAHRRLVLRRLEGPYPPLAVLHGYTGSGKTRLLGSLAGQIPLVDLEGLARHRGSAFGHVGLEPQPTQKLFDALLAGAFAAAGPGPVLLEGESPTIGLLRLPPPLTRAMREAPKIFLEIPRPVRARHLMEDYAPAIRDDPAVLEHALRYLGGRRPHCFVEELRQLLRSGDLLKFCDRLLEQHYDPLYERVRRRYQTGSDYHLIEVPDLDEALPRLRALLADLGFGPTAPAPAVAP